MTKQCIIAILSTLALIITACQLPWQQDPSGWRSPVSELFIDESAFPEDWEISFPEKIVTDPTTNHVGRTWISPEGSIANQGIWRAYTIAAAKRRYAELVENFVHPPTTPLPEEDYVAFEPPNEIDFQSQTVDKFYFACGWRKTAHCVMIARYRNYVTLMSLDREVKLNEHHTTGLTDPEIEMVLRGMDTKFEQFFAFPAAPVP